MKNMKNFEHFEVYVIIFNNEKSLFEYRGKYCKSYYT